MRRFMISVCPRKGVAALALTIVMLVAAAHAGEPAGVPVGGEVMGDFYVKDVGLPTAYVFTVLPKPENALAPAKLQSILGDVVKGEGNEEDAFEAGFNKANLALGVSWNAFSVADGVGTASGAGFLPGLKVDLGKTFIAAGVLSAAIQVIVDIRAGDKNPLAVNLYKNVANIGVNLLALSNAALSIALAGVSAIDISLTWLGEESVNLRLDKGRQAYIAYMEDVRSDPEWRDYIYNRTESLAKEGRLDKLPGVLEDELRRLMEGFWTTSEADVILKAGGRRHSVMQRSERQRITRDVELRIKRTLAEMVEELEAKQFQQLWLGYVTQVEKQKELLNTKFRLTVREDVRGGKPKMAGFRARFAGLDNDIPEDAWEFELDKDGQGSIDMTLLAFFQAGMPARVEIFPPGDDKPATSAAFVLKDQNTVVLVSLEEETPPASGKLWVLTSVHTLQSGDVGDKYFKYTYVVSANSFVRKATGIDGNSAGESIEVTGTASSPPPRIVPGQTLTLNLSIGSRGTSDQTLRGMFGTATIDAWLDTRTDQVPLDGAPAHSHGSATLLSAPQGRLESNSKNGFQTARGTASTTMPKANEAGSKIALYIRARGGGVRYVYTLMDAKDADKASVKRSAIVRNY